MSGDGLASVSALLIRGLKKRSETAEAMGTGERSDQQAMKESRIMLAICCVPLSLRSSNPEISQVELSPGSLILSVWGLLAMSLRRLSV